MPCAACAPGAAPAVALPPIIDAHVHFWRFSAAPDEYPWMTPAHAALKRDYLPADWLAAAAASGAGALVAVQARQTEAETDFLLGLADAHPFIRGVVGWVDLRAPPAALGAALARLAAHPRLVGVRHVVHDEPDDDFLGRADVRRGVGMLAAHGLAFDLLLRPRHLRAGADLAAAFPGTTFVLDHIAKPRVGGPLEPWRADLAALAACPNVAVKISGLVTEAPPGWAAADFVPYLDAVWAAFGAERVMLGSDWPVALLNAESHADAMRVATAWLEGKGAAAAAVRAGNAERIYRLKP